MTMPEFVITVRVTYKEDSEYYTGCEKIVCHDVAVDSSDIAFYSSPVYTPYRIIPMKDIAELTILRENTDGNVSQNSPETSAEI